MTHCIRIEMVLSSGLCSPSNVAQIIYFTDEQPQGLMKSLDYSLPQAEQVSTYAADGLFR